MGGLINLELPRLLEASLRVNFLTFMEKQKKVSLSGVFVEACNSIGAKIVPSLSCTGLILVSINPQSLTRDDLS